MTAIDQVERHLKDGFSITPIEALNYYKCFRLADIIFKLKKRGMDIDTVIVENGNKRYAKYLMQEKQRDFFSVGDM